MEEEITLLSSSSSSTSSSSLSIETCYHHDDSELVKLRRYSNDFFRSIPPRPHTLTFGAYESMEMMKQDDSRASETQSECKMETCDKESQVELSEVIKDNQGEQLITIKTEDDEQVKSSVEIECNQQPVQSENEMVKIGCINYQRSVKIKVNDLTPSSSQEFIGPAVGGRRSPGTPSSLASSTCSSPQASPASTPSKSPTPVDPSASSHSTKPSTTCNLGSTCGSTTTTIGGTTAKRCAKRNSNSGSPGSTNNLKQINIYTVNNNSLNHSKESREIVSDPIIRRKSWSSSIDQAGLGQNDFDHFIGDAPHRVVSLSSLDSDIEDTFYDARESDSPKRKMTQAKPSEQPSANTNNNHKKTIFTLTRYSSISASRLDDIVNTIDDPSEGEDKLRLKATGLTVSFEDLTLSESSDHKESQNTSTVNLQFDKPRSLSASSSEAIFNLNHHQSSSSPSQCNHANAPMVQSARSMSDIINVKPSLLDDCSSMKSGSNSSSRESISPSSVSANLTSKRLMATSPTPSTTLTSKSSSSSGKKVQPVTSPSTVTSKVTPTTIISPSHYYHHQYLTPPRSTLHKSISTPSILTAQEAVEEQSTPHERRDKNLSYISNQESDDEKSISKRKKRGSLFFRKKRKDKEVKKVSPHQFVSVCYSIAALCDVCKKALANKPAIKCENCMVTVHDSSCKDQILDCNKFRLAKKPSHLALTTKDRTISPMLQVPPGSNAKSSSPTSSVKEKKLVGFSKNHQSSSTLDTQGITCKPPSSSSPSINRKSYTPSGYSQWRRVATKLGVNKVICEDKELDTGEDGHSNIVETASGSMESLDEGVAEVITSEFEDDSALRLLDDEPESWNNTVDKKVLKRLKEKDIRRQEVIHELIITEKHHCLTLKIMQKIYAQGMIKELHMTKDMVERIFPCLEDLLETHLTFLKKLRERQSLDSVIDNIGDIILQQFSGSNGEQLRNCYGQFCSQHKEALSLYKDILKTDRKFQNFIKKCSIKPVCKTRGIPECILLVTQRITKYPLLIDSLLKVTKDSKCDYSDLKDALSHCKNVINRVDAQVAEKEKEIRLLEIYNKIDAKSTTIYKGKKFRKSDLLSNNRKLRHEAVLSWKSARGKVVDVIGVILSDVIILLQENNQKYHFCSLDNKSSVVSLQKLLVREKAGQSSRGVYLISSNPHEPEMYELICPTAKEQKILIDQIREAVEICPDEEEDCPNECEEKKIEEARKAKVRELLNSMYEKDARMAQMCEDKMKIFADMMELLGIEQEGIELIRYVPMIEDNCSPETIINAANEAFRIAHNLYVSGTNLCRSVSSAGEHQSDTFVSPILPKRAETFGGFDNPEKDPLLRLNALKKKLGQLKDSAFTENDVTGHSRPSEGDPDGSALNMGSTLSTASSSSSSTTTMTQGPTNESFLAIRPTLTDHRRSSGPLVNKCSSNASSPEKIQRRSLVTTPTPSIQSLFASSSTALAPISPSSSTSSSSSSMFATLPLYDPSDIYRLTTTPLLMTQGKDQLIQIAELQHQVNLLMCLFNYQQTLFENMRFQLMDSNNKIIQLQKDNIYCGNNGRDAKSDRRSVYRPEQGLEELRNLQEQLRMEKSEWIKKLNEEKTGIESERQSLEDLKEQVRKEQKDVEEQRELLYRKLETLQKEGIILSPAHTIVNTGNLRINPDLVNRGNGLNNNCNSHFSNNSNNNNNSPCNATGISDCDRLTGSSCNQFTRSVGTNFNNISFPSCVSSTPTSGTIVSSETPSLTSSDKVNQSSSSAPRTPSLAFNSASNSSPIKQQLPLKLAVNEPGQGRCNHSQVVNSPSNQQIPATIGTIPYQTQ